MGFNSAFKGLKHKARNGLENERGFLEVLG